MILTAPGRLHGLPHRRTGRFGHVPRFQRRVGEGDHACRTKNWQRSGFTDGNRWKLGNSCDFFAGISELSGTLAIWNGKSQREDHL